MSRWTSEDFLGVFESVGDWSGMCIQTHEPPHTSLIEVSRVKKHREQTWRGNNARHDQRSTL